MQKVSTKIFILKDKLKNKDESEYSNALAFAIKEDLFPIFDKDFLNHIADDGYSVDKCKMLEVYVNLQNHYYNKEKIIFEDIKSQIRVGSVSKGRDLLVNICRYFYLSNKFDQDFWNNFIKPAEYFTSIEIQSINKKFNYYELDG